MKKLKYCFLLIICACFIFAGCAGDRYLKTKSTNLSLATFYSNYYVPSVNEFQNVDQAENIIALQSDRTTYSNYMLPFYEAMPEERCLISAVDYLCAVNQADSSIRIDSKTKTKLYEYSTIFKNELKCSSKTESMANMYANVRALVVIKGSTNNGEILAYLFYKSTTEEVNLATLLENLNTATYTFSFTLNKYSTQTKSYLFSYGKNGSKSGCDATFTFNNAKGALNIQYKTYLGESSSSTTIKKDVYKYSNGVVGVRATSNFKTTSSTMNVIYEQMQTDFYKRLKVGEIKDDSNMLSMETMQETELAKANVSDSIGFEFEYNTQDDEKENTITCIKYGTEN